MNPEQDELLAHANHYEHLAAQALTRGDIGRAEHWLARADQAHARIDELQHQEAT